MLLAWPVHVLAEPPLNGFVRENSNGAVILRFTDADYVRTDSGRIPAGGWVRGPAHRGFAFEKMGATSTTKTLWLRLRFDRRMLPAGPVALYTENNYERIAVLLNGQEIFRNFTEGDDRALGWYRPQIVRLPAPLLAGGTNSLLVKIESNYDLVSGDYYLGPAAALDARHERMHFWRITGVQAANLTMIVLAAAALWFWLLRRGDTELLLLAILGLMWFARDYNFTAVRAPFNIVAFKAMTYYAVYPAMSASLAFCLVYVRLPRWKLHGAILLTAGVLLCLIRFATVEWGLTGAFGTDSIGNLLAVACVAYTAFLLVTHWWRTRDAGAALITLCLATIITGTTHDIGRQWDSRLWDGLGFFLQPYIGSLFCLVLLLSFGRRANLAFGRLEGLNAELETRVEDARAALEEREREVRELEVARALETERGRIMREMHDGIGSNLVAALTVAERQNHPPASIATLKRALSDLKLTVDSLEPLAGDVVALLGNFRHRSEPDLVEAGIKLHWNVDRCERIDWLDATNSLHLLRLFQEALANVMMHSGATRIDLACVEYISGGAPGVTVSIKDNGSGFDTVRAVSGGQGLCGMRSRAEAIGGTFLLSSVRDEGTVISVWLPYVRQTEAR
ncbi:signal transduction histidine kinase [Sphingopyxis panaciterrae]|uniref:sensor histidine kinase n=1 Tax=Sphingopyxis panaciterrae TaxID=363841 RepID=UPI00141F40BE|nr:ATP-binding protein [Sphingopyxis panaciterrae]NIJ38503.1 signal transduction histidine kinase [Sphingopyxis panaciterrae]